METTIEARSSNKAFHLPTLTKILRLCTLMSTSHIPKTIGEGALHLDNMMMMLSIPRSMEQRRINDLKEEDESLNTIYLTWGTVSYAGYHFGHDRKAAVNGWHRNWVILTVYICGLSIRMSKQFLQIGRVIMRLTWIKIQIYGDYIWRYLNKLSPENLHGTHKLHQPQHPDHYRTCS